MVTYFPEIMQAQLAAEAMCNTRQSFVMSGESLQKNEEKKIKCLWPKTEKTQKTSPLMPHYPIPRHRATQFVSLTGVPSGTRNLPCSVPACYGPESSTIRWCEENTMGCCKLNLTCNLPSVTTHKASVNAHLAAKKLAEIPGLRPLK